MDKDEKMTKRRRFAWSIATEVSIKTGENVADIYARLMDEFKGFDKDCYMALAESHET